MNKYFAASVLSLLMSRVLASPVSGDSRLPSLKQSAAKGFLVGAAYNAGGAKEDRLYESIFAEQFNSVTPENAMKFEPTEPSANHFTFQPMDQVIDFALRNKMEIHAHVLVWHNQLPAWVMQITDSAQIEGALKNHVAVLANRLKTRAALVARSWDVVNEVIDPNTANGLRKTHWSKIGKGEDDYIKKAFNWARDADPNATLFINDYSTEESNSKSDQLYTWVKKWKAAGIPIQGVGFQCHFRARTLPTNQQLNSRLASIQKNFQRFADLGLKIRITEMDFGLPDDAQTSQNAVDVQAAAYAGVLSACIVTKACVGFTSWGVTDKYSWLPHAAPGLGGGLLLDKNYLPKVAFFSMRKALRH